MPRKTTGCWTCRARKKKCDDRRPFCTACTLRSITCYGYDGKPDWMDGGQKEKQTMHHIRRQIKESYKHRRSVNSKRRSIDLCRSIGTSLVLAPSTSTEISPSLSRQDLISMTPRSDETALSPGVSTLVETDYQHDACLDAISSELTAINDTELYKLRSEPRNLIPISPKNGIGTHCSYTEQEIDLVMYYLDHIFPRIHPYFKYSAADSGRGWILNLFLRTKPLCTAVACLSACDQAQFLLGPLSDIPQPYQALEMQHLQSVVDLRGHLDQLSKKTGTSQMVASVEALACIMHLILFELWIPRKGLMNDWLMHLDAASALLSSVDAASATSRGLRPLLEDLNMLENFAASDMPMDLLSKGERCAFEWFLTLYAYCFINSAASLGLTPNSIEAIPRIRALFHKDQSKLKDMCGCEDWVLLTVLDIAVLNDWKQKARNTGSLSVKELTRRAHQIEERLTNGLLKLASPSSFFTSASTTDSTERQQCMVTHIYLNAALVFLHVVVSGFYPKLPEIRNNVMGTLRALEYIRESSTINFPSWPYCVAGCLALESDYPRFRALVPPWKKGEHPLVMSKWTLDILEECWKTRKMQPEGQETCSWVTAMNHLGTRLLLV